MAARVTALPVHSLTPRHGVPRDGLVAIEHLGDADVARPPHRHRFAQLVVIEAGSGNHLIDFAPVPIRPGEAHMLAPGQVHSWDAVGLAGRALMFSEQLLDGVGVLPEQIRELTLLGIAPMAIPADTMSRINSLLDVLADTVSVESARHLVTAVLWECIHGSMGIAPHRRHSSLTRAYLELVLRAPNAQATVTAFAAQLGVTSGYLTQAVTADTGATPGGMMRTALAREAQRLLGGTELTAAQISTRLGFSEASYFSRFFRREVGCTPTAYRSMRMLHSPQG